MAAKYKVPSLALRMVRERTLTLAKETCNTNADAAAIAHALIGSRPIEFLIAIMVDGQGRVTSVATLAQGGLHGLGCAPRDVLRAVLAAQASGFILAHNHPSGDPTASPEDRVFTRKISEAAAIVGAPLLDHVIVTREAASFSSVPLS